MTAENRLNVLAFDSTAPILTVGIAVNGRCLGRWDAIADRSRGGTLDELINRALHVSGMARGDITGLALVTGPGSLTALRIGWATASGWALATGIPVVGWTVAEVQKRFAAPPDSRPSTSDEVYCLAHHRGEEFYLYDLSPAHGIGKPSVTTREGLRSQVKTGARIVGPGLLNNYDLWQRTLPDGVKIIGEADAIVGGDKLAKWGHEELTQGRSLDLSKSPLDYGLPPVFRKLR